MRRVEDSLLLDEGLIIGEARLPVVLAGDSKWLRILFKECLSLW
jgi:hypothetical protein